MRELAAIGAAPADRKVRFRAVTSAITAQSVAVNCCSPTLDGLLFPRVWAALAARLVGRLIQERAAQLRIRLAIEAHQVLGTAIRIRVVVQSDW